MKGRRFCGALLLGGLLVGVAPARDVSLARGQLLLTPSHEGWGMRDCAACHLLFQIHEDAPHIRGIVREKGYDSCGGCHGENGAGVERRCLICHNARDLPRSPWQAGIHAHDFSVRGDRPLEDRDCLICHRAADMDGRWEIEIDLTRFPDRKSGLNEPYRHEAEFCLRCHNLDHQQPGFAMRPRFDYDPLVYVDLTYRYMDEHGWKLGSGQRTYAGLRPGYRYGTVMRCTECHAMHGTRNEKLLIDNSAKGTFRLKSRGLEIPVEVSDGNLAQLCVLCHRMEVPLEDARLDTGNGLAGVHRISGDCTLCHSHGKPTMTGL